MPNYQKFKTIARLQLFGDDDVWTSNSNSVYKANGSNVINAKRMRFNLEGALNDIRLSKRARLIMEGCFLPNITNMNTSILRVCTATEDVNWDSKKKRLGNPILVAFKDPNVAIYNCTPDFYNISVPSNFLQNGYIELELETNSTLAVDYITGAPLSKFYLTCIIVDDDDEQTQDPNLAPPYDLKLYGRKGQPIRPAIASISTAGVVTSSSGLIG